MSDRIFAAIWLLLCLAGAAIAWQIQSEYSYEPLGPRPFPLGIIGLEPSPELDQRPEQDGALLLAQARLGNQAAELDLLARVLLAGIGR